MKNENNHGEEQQRSITFGTQGFSEEFTSSVGKLTLNFAHLEFMFSLFAGMHMNTGYPFNELVLSELSFRQLINVSVGLHELLEPIKSERDRFKEIAKNATLLEQERNTITHSFYGQTESKAIIRHKNVTRMRGGYRQQRQEITANDILTIANKIEDLSFTLGNLIHEIDGSWWEDDSKNPKNQASHDLKELIIENKQKYLNENYPFEDLPDLNDEKCCLHCQKIIKVGDYKVFKDEMRNEFICCPNTPDCNGTVIDWVSTNHLESLKNSKL
ncbi:MAG: hypothetical protein MUC81_02380 [Bacteroidia bacterium]|jgi:hypothetical protein|nr:hypothetical protein [Bacteroidia bacterium]